MIEHRVSQIVQALNPLFIGFISLRKYFDSRRGHINVACVRRSSNYNIPCEEGSVCQLCLYHRPRAATCKPIRSPPSQLSANVAYSRRNYTSISSTYTIYIHVLVSFLKRLSNIYAGANLCRLQRISTNECNLQCFFFFIFNFIVTKMMSLRRQINR